jgi:uncharacterized protein YndB with AHSA1/START domain
MSDHATVVGHTIYRTIRVEVPRARVWSTLTEPALISQWLGEKAEFATFAVGSAGVFEWEGFGTFPLEITEITPLEAFAFRWSGEPADVLEANNSTVVRFSLVDDGTATLVTVVESGFETLQGGTAHRRNRLQENREGWDVEFDDLRAFLGA